VIQPLWKKPQRCREGMPSVPALGAAPVLLKCLKRELTSDKQSELIRNVLLSSHSRELAEVE
jgi:hypothetical protein